MEQTKQITLPEFIKTNLQRTKQLFKIPTNPNKEFRSERRIVIREAYKLLLSKLSGKNYINLHEFHHRADDRKEKGWETRPVQLRAHKKSV